MLASPLSRFEVAAALDAQVRRFVSLGMPRHQAITAAARDNHLARADVESVLHWFREEVR
jgi:hypothetical protein